MASSLLQYVNINDIQIGERARKDYGDLDELAASIKEKGIIQPITLDTQLNLLAGGRRLTAAKIAGLLVMPCLVREVSGTIDALEIELVENIQRKDMTWQERVNLTAKIDNLYKRKDPEWSGRKTAQILSKSIGGVNRHLQLAEAIGIAPELSKCKTEDDAFKLIKKAQKTVTINKLRVEQDKRMESLPMVQHAQHHYRIGDAIKELEILRDLHKQHGSMIKFFEVDPPYGIELNDVKKGDSVTSEYKEVEKANYRTWLEYLAQLLYDVAAQDAWCIFWFGPTWFTEVKNALLLAGWFVDDIPAIWIKGNGQTNTPAFYLGRAYEPFFIARKGVPSINKQGRSNVFDFAPVNPADKWHPTQRPLALIENILETFTVPGTICCSPFLGSGTTLLAAYRQKMACFGWDLNEKCRDRFLIEVEEMFRGENII